MTQTVHPFDLLKALAGQCRRKAAGLPAQEQLSETWSGIGFRLAGCDFVAAMGEVSEILHEPRYTPLPRVKGWVRGVANVRGRLLPVVDLARFFSSSVVTPRKQRRVLVLDRDDLFVGLLVDQLLGMQHFPVSGFRLGAQTLPADIEPFVVGGYLLDDRPPVHVFNFRALARDQAFLDVAV
ncbi:MAG: chemotaxis protein CheW [Halopseudomonas yangmingensis]